MASVTHQALLMVGSATTAVAGRPGWERQLSGVPPSLARDRHLQARDDASSYANSWLHPIAAVATVVNFGWTNRLATVAPRVRDTSRIDPSSYANAWLSPPDFCDASFSSVVLLLGFEGADASTVMTDESPAAHGNATIVGTAQIDTAQFKFGSSSLLLDGGGNIRFADSNDWNLSNGLFTIEMWVRFSDIGNGLQSIIAQLETPSQRAWQVLSQTIFPQLNWIVSTSGSTNLTDIHGNATPVNNVWYHFAVDYDGSKYRSYIDGVLDGSSATARTIFNSTAVLSIGADSNNNARLKGWLDEIRITKGVARYATDTSFEVPTKAFPRESCNGSTDKWNSADKSASITLSNSDRTATSTAGGNAGVRTVGSHSTGKYYFEIGVTSITGNLFDNDGLAISTGTQALTSIAYGANSLYIRPDGLIYVGGVSTTKSTNALNGGGSMPTIGFAIDLTAQRAWVRNSFNGNKWIGTTATPNPNPETGVDGFDVSGIFGGVAVFPAMTGDNSSTDIATFNQTLVYTPPSGFSPW